MITVICARCLRKKPPTDFKFCIRCKDEVRDEMKRANYLTIGQERHKPRSLESREDVLETKRGREGR